MGFWDNIKKDLKKGIDEGIHILKEGTSTVIEWAEDLTDEGKKKIKQFEIKQKIQTQFTELGGKIHDLMEKNVKSPVSHPQIKSILKKIDALKEQLKKVDVKKKAAPKKKVKKKSAKKKAKKTAAKKTVAKKTTT